MSRIPELDVYLSNLQITDDKDFICSENKHLEKLSHEYYSELVENSAELGENAKIIDALSEEEIHLSEILQKNCEDICRLESQVKIQETRAQNLKKQVDARRKDHQDKCNEMIQTEKIETALGDTIMHHLGIRLKLSPIKNGIWETKFIYQDDKSVTLLLNDIDWSFDLQLIEPPHPAFDNIRAFLQYTGDINGFLCALRSYFSQKSVT